MINYLLYINTQDSMFENSTSVSDLIFISL